MSLCQCGGMETAVGSLHLLGGSQLCPALHTMDQAAPKACGLKLLVCCRDAVFPGEAPTCVICPDVAALK